jgi:hypothetical protein
MYKLPFLRGIEGRAAADPTDIPAACAASAVLLQAIALPATSPLGRLARRWHALGPVLWLWRARSGHAADLSTVAGWNCVHRIEPDGICEALRFYRDDGRELARLYLLPDSDYLAWEQLLQCVPCSTPEPQRGLHQRLREAAFSRAGHAWQGAVVRFCHATDTSRPWLLAEAAASVSTTGRRRAMDICAGLDATLSR